MSDLKLKGVFKAGGSSHSTPRRSVGLNFTDMGEPRATALTYFKELKLATPLFWSIMDQFASYGSTLTSKMKEVPPEQFADELLKELGLKEKAR